MYVSFTYFLFTKKMATQNVTISMDPNLKKIAAHKAKQDGISLSAAAGFLFKAYAQGLFKIGATPVKLTENGLTPEEEAEILQISEDAKKGINVDGPFEGDEVLKYLDSLK